MSYLIDKCIAGRPFQAIRYGYGAEERRGNRAADNTIQEHTARRPRFPTVPLLLAFSLSLIAANSYAQEPGSYAQSTPSISHAQQTGSSARSVVKKTAKCWKNRGVLKIKHFADDTIWRTNKRNERTEHILRGICHRKILDGKHKWEKVRLNAEATRRHLEIAETSRNFVENGWWYHNEWQKLSQRHRREVNELNSRNRTALKELDAGYEREAAGLWWAHKEELLQLRAQCPWMPEPFHLYEHRMSKDAEPPPWYYPTVEAADRMLDSIFLTYYSWKPWSEMAWAYEDRFESPDLGHLWVSYDWGYTVGDPIVVYLSRMVGEISQFIKYSAEDLAVRWLTFNLRKGRYQPYSFSFEKGGIYDSWRDIQTTVRGALDKAYNRPRNPPPFNNFEESNCVFEPAKVLDLSLSERMKRAFQLAPKYILAARGNGVAAHHRASYEWGYEVGDPAVVTALRTSAEAGQFLIYTTIDGLVQIGTLGQQHGPYQPTTIDGPGGVLDTKDDIKNALQGALDKLNGRPPNPPS